MTKTLVTLRDTFEFMKASSERGVRGIYRIRGEKPVRGTRPVRLITALTHACEVNGLAALRYLMNHESEIAKKIEGDILLIINNVKGAEQHFEKSTPSYGALWYWVDVNMNRLPRNALSKENRSYEVRRLQKLYPWYKEATIALDIHALPKPGGGMVIDIKGGRAALDRIAPAISVPVRVRNVVKTQRGVPISFFYGGLGKSIPVIEVESGVNLTKRGEAIAVRTALDFLFPAQRRKQKVYEIFWALRFPTLAFQPVRILKNFEKVRRGQELATSPRKTVVAPADGYAFFTRTLMRYTDPGQLETEVLFLARKRR
jgi:hypothetical protein